MASILILSSSPLAVHAIVPMPMDGTMRWGVPGAKEPLGARHTGKALATDTAPLHARPGHGVWHGARDTRRFPSLGRAHLVVQLHVKYLARDTAARTVAFVRRRWAHQCKRHRLHQPHEHAAPRLSAPSPLPPALSQHKYTVLPKHWRAVFSLHEYSNEFRGHARKQEPVSCSSRGALSCPCVCASLALCRIPCVRADPAREQGAVPPAVVRIQGASA